MKKNIVSGIQSMAHVQQSKRVLVFSVCGVGVVVITALLLFSDVRFLLQSGTAQRAYARGDVATAQRIYTSLAQHPRLGYIATQNSAVLAYEQKEYETAFERMMPVVQETCFTQEATATSSTYSLTLKDNPPTYCDVVSYNLGNILYRIGEAVASSSASTTATATSSPAVSKTTKTFWYQAVAGYQSDLAIAPDDTDAQDNIDFILQQLQEEQDATSSEQKQGSESDTQQDDTQSDQGAQGEEGGEGEKDGERGQADQEQQGAGESEGDTETQEGEGEQVGEEGEQSEHAVPQDNRQLSDDASKQVDQYMQQLEQRSQQMQEYFRQNPEAAPAPQQGNGVFDDPFFNQFFGTPDTPRGVEGNGSLEKDW